MNLNDALKWLEENEELENNDEHNTNDVCPISRLPIQHKIKLKCGHEFEYINLFQELLMNNRSYTYHKCPYCRKYNEGFIPFYEIEEMNNYFDIKSKYNYFKNNYLTCVYCFKSGKNKGHTCGNIAHKFSSGNYCFKHHYYENNKKNMKEINNSKNNKSKSKKKEFHQCSHILKNGFQCKNSACKTMDTNGLCKIHFKMIQNMI